MKIEDPKISPLRIEVKRKRRGKAGNQMRACIQQPSQSDRYVVFSQNAELLIGHEKNGRIYGVTTFTPKVTQELDAGSELVIRQQGMSRVQVASVMKALSNPGRKRLIQTVGIKDSPSI